MSCFCSSTARQLWLPLPPLGTWDGPITTSAISKKLWRKQPVCFSHATLAVFACRLCMALSGRKEKLCAALIVNNLLYQVRSSEFIPLGGGGSWELRTEGESEVSFLQTSRPSVHPDGQMKAQETVFTQSQRNLTLACFIISWLVHNNLSEACNAQSLLVQTYQAFR